MDTTESKPVLKSKTMWLNGFVILAIVASTVLESQGIDAMSWFDAETTAGIAAIVNLILRMWFTSKPLTMK